MKKIIAIPAVVLALICLGATVNNIKLFTDYPNSVPIGSDFFVFQRNTSFINSSVSQVKQDWFHAPVFSGNGGIQGVWTATTFVGDGSQLTGINGGSFTNVVINTITNNTFVNTNIFISTTTNYNNYEIVTNLYSTNITVDIITNNTFVGGTIFTTNFYSTNITVDVITNNTFYSTNVVVQNITNQNFYTTNITVEQPGGFTNMNLTPLTVMFADANSAESSLPNATGVLTNNGSGGVGFSQSLSLTELDAQNFYPTNMFLPLTNVLLSTDGNGQVTNAIVGSGLGFSGNTLFSTGTNTTVYASTNFVTNLYATTIYGDTNYLTNLYFLSGRGNTLIVTNLTVISGLTNESLLANQFVATDANKSEISTLDGSSLTNLTIRYDTNSIPSSGALTFGHAYFTNLQASVVLPAFTLGSAAYYETLVICVTNSTAATTTLTMPSGVKVAIANGGGNLIYCTNGTRTMVFVDHYGTVLTNAWKNDF